MAGKKQAAIPPELKQLRESIDNIDAALIYLLAERFRCTRRVGELKASTGLPAADPGRESVMIKRLKALAKDAKLDPAFAEKFLNFIIAEVIRHHESIRNGGRPPLASSRPRKRASSNP
ncbi:MAG: chorismate mutase [Hyphomicrobiales bacterium]|nr:chorismate mutase [Hyphomicrobiales bacterium]